MVSLLRPCVRCRITSLVKDLYSGINIEYTQLDHNGAGPYVSSFTKLYLHKDPITGTGLALERNVLSYILTTTSGPSFLRDEQLLGPVTA